MTGAVEYVDCPKCGQHFCVETERHVCAVADTLRPEYTAEQVAEATARLEELTRNCEIYRQVKFGSDIRTILSALASAELDTARLAILNAAIEDDRLFIDGNSLPPVSAYPPDEDEAYVVYDLTAAADELIAHAEKTAAMTKERE